MDRAEFDKFLSLYGIPPSDEKYTAYKKSQTSTLINKQYNELAGQVKKKLGKPKYPDIIVGPGTAPGNKANMDKYHKNLDAYNKQQELLKRNKDLITKLEKTHQKSVSKPKSSIQYDPNVTQETQHMLDKVNQSLNNPTKDEEYEKQQYQKFQQQQRDKASGKIPKSTPDIRAPKITPSGIVKPKPHQLPNTQRHINHNHMTFQEFKNFRFNSGFEVGQKEYLTYLRGYGINKPTEHIQGQVQLAHNASGHSSLAKGQSIEEHQKQHSQNIVQHLTKNNVAVPGAIKKVTPPAVIKLHNFNLDYPSNANINEHEVASHSLNKQAGTMVGNPVYANSAPKVASGVREDAHPALINKSKVITPMSATPAVLSREQQEQAQYAKFQAQQAAGGSGQQIRSLPNP